MLAAADFSGFYKIPQIDTTTLLDAETTFLRSVADDFFISRFLTSPPQYWYSVLDVGRSDFAGMKPFLIKGTFYILTRRGVLSNIPSQGLKGRFKNGEGMNADALGLSSLLEYEWGRFRDWISVRRNLTASCSVLSTTATTTDLGITLNIQGGYTGGVQLKDDDYYFFEAGEEVVVGNNREMILNVINPLPSSYQIQISGSYSSLNSVVWDFFIGIKDKEYIMGL